MPALGCFDAALLGDSRAKIRVSKQIDAVLYDQGRGEFALVAAPVFAGHLGARASSGVDQIAQKRFELRVAEQRRQALHRLGFPAALNDEACLNTFVWRQRAAAHPHHKAAATARSWL